MNGVLKNPLTTQKDKLVSEMGRIIVEQVLQVTTTRLTEINHNGLKKRSYSLERCALVVNQEAHQWGQLVNGIERP